MANNDGPDGCGGCLITLACIAIICYVPQHC